MWSYLVHIYQRESRAVAGDSLEIIGIVEGIESDRRYPFTNRDELWDILAEKRPACFSTGKTVKPGGNGHD